jgi:hypothetical protein
VTPGHDVGRRIAAIEARNPDVMVWPPDISISGRWEAAGSEWLIKDKRPRAFASRLEARVAGQAPAAEAADPLRRGH